MLNLNPQQEEISENNTFCPSQKRTAEGAFRKVLHQLLLKKQTEDVKLRKTLQTLQVLKGQRE